MIRITLAEDNHFLAQSLIEKLEFFDSLKLKFWAKNGAILLNYLNEDTNIDVVLMDIQMPVLDGIETTRKLKFKYPHIKVIMLTVFDDEHNILKAIQAGANGYLLKDESPEVLHKSIHEIIEGGAPMTPSVALKALKLLRNPLPDKYNAENDKEYNLTTRETEVLTHLSKGLNHNEISTNLNISSATVRKHIENIYKKLQVRNKLEAVNLANKERLI